MAFSILLLLVKLLLMIVPWVDGMLVLKRGLVFLVSEMVNGEIFYEGQLVSESFANALIPSLKLFFTVSEPSHWNTWVLSAATSSQLSYDSWDEGLDRQSEFGAFTYYLLKAFGYRMDTGTPALPEGRLTFYTIYDTIKSTMSETLWRRATPQATLTPVDLVLF